MSDVKRVIVTGASGGIGRELVRELVREGLSVCAVSRSGQRMQALLPEQCLLTQADITCESGRQALVQAAETFRPDALINLAGTNQFAHFTDQTEQDIASLITLNLTAQMQVTRLLLPVLEQAGTAQIINVGSTLGAIGYPGYAAYCASKFGLRGFSEALQRELSDTGIRIRYFAPRATDTELNSRVVDELNATTGSKTDSPEQVAQKLVAFMKGKSLSQHLGWPEKVFVRVNALLPGLVSRSVHKQLSTIKHYLNKSRVEG